MIHKNSKLAYEQIKPELKGRRRDIYLTILQHGKKITDREVKDLMGLPDMNSVRPRITELVKDGYLDEIDDVKCPVTNKTVRRINIPTTGQLTLF
jgi:isopropylmalate/homocitrate/citramalate synthase